ncbi:MAG: rRNA-processing protein bfr2 [Vezdaea acicularis]|nr:MAG: rRNA-processing protein bfr2 [Vezdaea acicularis]
MRFPRSLAQQIADLEDPTPIDFDPEGLSPAETAEQVEVSDAEESLSQGREHYEVAPKSKLRGQGEPLLGPQYGGSRVSRNALQDEDELSDDDPFGSGQTAQKSILPDAESAGGVNDGAIDDGYSQEIDSDEAFGDSDLEKFKDFTFRGSKKPTEPNGAHFPEDLPIKGAVDISDGDTDMTGQGKESSTSEEDEGMAEASSMEEDFEADDGYSSEASLSGTTSSVSSSASSPQSPSAERAHLRKLMQESQSSVLAGLTEAARADALKGAAVLKQRETFDALLNTRIRLQKALIATNTLPTLTTFNSSEPPTASIAAAEEAALRLWTTLDSLHNTLSPVPSKKRKRIPNPTTFTSTATLWSQTISHEALSQQSRNGTLTKWSTKIRGASTVSLSNRLNTANTQQSITDVLASHLSDSARLVARTRVPRSCAPFQAAKRPGEEDAAVFDDSELYQALLRELVAQRITSTATNTPAGGIPASAALNGSGENAWASITREARARKKVDTKASKGRKLRYTVHEKLQNFMAPEDRGEWGERQAGELFGGLLGRRVELGEADEDGTDVDEGEGLRLFGGV